ncbi:MAG: VWA domain-containing protein [Rhodothermales bacterium]
MRPFLFACFACICSLASSVALADGVGVVDASEGVFLRLERSEVSAAIENQIALTTATQTFQNTFADSVRSTYVFPLPQGASATSLRWRVNGVWREAVFTAAPPDTTLPGGGGEPDPGLEAYLAESEPFYFAIPQAVQADSSLVVEISYVQLLPYSFGDVEYRYPHDYRSIQTAPLDAQRLELTLTSSRMIDAINFISHSGATVLNDGATASVVWESFETVANADYRMRYTLNPDELGLFGFSTFLADSTVADDGNRGFLVFVVEPDASDVTESIDKVFTLIVDRSGSMRGDKIVQARNAANFIVNNLDEGDRFNIVDFASNVSSFRPEHVEYTAENRDAALAYISGFQADGSTNISGAFGVAVPQFSAASEETANLIVFFTDGEATAGITQTEPLAAYVRDLILDTETGVIVFTFGIGESVNRQLLTLLASENDGFAQFLGEDELESVITDFYLQIRNPVLLDTEIAFAPAVVSDVHPDPPPSLFKGQQMIVSGRYDEAVPVTITLSGQAFGQPVSYAYDLGLADSSATRYQFLPKVWAKLKIEDLLVLYYSLPEGSPEAEEVRDEIVAISLAWGVTSPFTSLSDGGENPVDAEEEEAAVPTSVELLGAYPNPFVERTHISFRTSADVAPQVAVVKIYNVLGQLVRVLAIEVQGEGAYEVIWDGRMDSGARAAAGTYIYVVSLEDAVLSGKLTLLQ